MKKCTFLFILIICSLAGYSQQSGLQLITLEDLSAFKTQAGNWQIVGDVTINPSMDIHEHPKQPETPIVKGKKKKKSEPDKIVTERPKAVLFKPGKGILLNMNNDTKKDNLISAFEHGDIELELEVMLPRGSNSGIYLQGRYEIQLLDSWGVKNPKYSDIGGIYRNWEKEPGKIYMGKAPSSNPAKAPGLWQKMKISFRAPKFDNSGKKIANARFASVELNGIKIHDNIEVPLPTGGPIENNEKATGPLMIQGDHGPVAIRNIKYRLMKEAEIVLNNISYRTYYGNFKTVSDYVNLTPSASGTLEKLTCEILEIENGYGSTYTADITVPEDGEYQFHIRFSGGGTFKVNNQELLNYQRPDGWVDEQKTIALKKGTYPLEINNYKDVGWMPPLLGLWVETATIYPQALHAFNSFPPAETPTSPILLNPGDSPRLLRAFIDFKGDRSRRLTHTIGVGEPGGINYVYDLGSGNLVCAWHGGFVNATPMWNDRGDGSFRPVGAAQYLFTGQPLAFLSNETESFPSMSNAEDFKSKGYKIDEATSRPIFKYTYRGLEVEDKINPEDANRILTREITIKNRGEKSGLFFKLAEGSEISQTPDGSYTVDDKQYYIKVDPSLHAKIREVDGKKELVVPVNGNSVKFSVLW